MPIPAMDLSIQRQSTVVEAGKPLLISGRLSLLGIGLPAVVRVFVDGPKYDPASRHFDTFSSPFTGDYSTNVLAEKEGEYEVYAQAYLPTPLALPFLPEPLILGPTLAESPKPPIVVGTPTAGGLVKTITEAGSQVVPTPSFDISVPIMVEVAAPGVQAAPTLLPAPPPPISISELKPLEQPSVPNANMFGDPVASFPHSLTIGDTLGGQVTVPSQVPVPYSIGSQLYLLKNGVKTIISPASSTTVNRGVMIIPASDFNTSGLSPGTYDIFLQMWDTAGNTFLLIDVGDLAMKSVPPPKLPTANMLGTPVPNLPTTVTAGTTWKGNISIPTNAPIDYTFKFGVSLYPTAAAPSGIKTVTQTVKATETVNLPISFYVAALANPGTYNVELSVWDELGHALIDRMTIGVLSIVKTVTEAIAAIPTPVVPTLPAMPTLTTVDISQIKGFLSQLGTSNDLATLISLNNAITSSALPNVIKTALKAAAAARVRAYTYGNSFTSDYPDPSKLFTGYKGEINVSKPAAARLINFDAVGIEQVFSVARPPFGIQITDWSDSGSYGIPGSSIKVKYQVTNGGVKPPSYDSIIAALTSPPSLPSLP